MILAITIKTGFFITIIAGTLIIGIIAGLLAAATVAIGSDIDN